LCKSLYWAILGNCRNYLPNRVRRIPFGSTNRMAFRCDHCSNSVIRKLIRMIKSIVSIAFATALMGSVAFAQTSTSSTTVATQPNGVTQTTTTESFGTVTEFTPGDSLILKTEAAEPVRYKFDKTVTYVNAHGKVIQPSKIKTDSKVRVHWVKQGDDMLVDKVILTPKRD
jgi:hypothetical protein